MNILILSCGLRVKMVEYFQRSLKGRGKVIAADCSHLAPALYAADAHYIVPRITDSTYIDSILEICEKEKIKGVLTLIDPELSLLAENMHRFSAAGVTVIGSEYDVCERCLDKWEMYQWMCEHGFPCAKTFIDLDEFDKAVAAGEIGFPVIVKPIRGSASIAVEKVDNRERVAYLFARSKDLLIQEYMDGEDLDADCYIDLITGEVISIFTKRKLLMRAGEADKAISFKDETLFELLERFIYENGFRGPIDIDVFKVNGKYFLSEVNPRFGGVYPHAYESGVDFTEYILHNLDGEPNKKHIAGYEDGIVMMKYPEIKIIREV